MTGVEILSAEEVVISRVFNFKLFWIVGGTVFVIIFLLFMLSTYCPDFGEICSFVIIALILGAAAGSLFGALAARPAEYGTEYKVTVSDEVSMSEFLEHYEIIDTEGKIFTVRELDGE